MSITVGMPTMFLGRQSGAQGKKTGNAKAVLCEALKERWTSDPDYKPDRTKDNIYLTGVTSGLELYQRWTDRADSYVQVQKNGKERKLRSDAHIGFAGICKPSGDSEYGSYTEQQQIQFCRDSFEVLQKVYGKYGITLDYGVIQVDEGNVHLHYGGHDDDFRLTKRIGLKLFNDLNKGDYIKLMKQKGWSVQPLGGYDPQKAAEMSPEQLEEYKAEQIKRKKSRKNGKSARQYKAEQEQKKSKALQAEIEQQKQELQRQQEQLKRDRELLAKRETEVTEREYAADERAETLYAEHNTPTTRKSVVRYTLIKTDDLRALQEDNEVLKRRSDREGVYKSTLKAAVEDKRQAAEARLKAEQERKQAERLRIDEQAIIQNEVSRQVAEKVKLEREKADRIAERKYKYQIEELQKQLSEATQAKEKAVQAEMSQWQQAYNRSSQAVKRYKDYIAEKGLQGDYTQWLNDKRGLPTGAATTKKNNYTFDYEPNA